MTNCVDNYGAVDLDAHQQEQQRDDHHTEEYVCSRIVVLRLFESPPHEQEQAERDFDDTAGSTSACVMLKPASSLQRLYLGEEHSVFDCRRAESKAIWSSDPVKAGSDAGETGAYTSVTPQIQTVRCSLEIARAVL